MIGRGDFQTKGNDTNSLDGKRFIDKEGTTPGSELTARYFNDIHDGYLATMDFVGMQPDGSSEIGRTGQILEMNKRMAFVMANPVMTLKIQYPGLPSPSQLPNNYGIWFDVSHLEIFAGAFTRFQDNRENATSSSNPPKVARDFAGQTTPEPSGVPNIKFANELELTTFLYLLVYNNNINKILPFKPKNRQGLEESLSFANPVKDEPKFLPFLFDLSSVSTVYQDNLKEVKPINITTIPWLCVGYTWEQDKVAYFSNVAHKFIPLDQIYAQAGITKPADV